MMEQIDIDNVVSAIDNMSDRILELPVDSTDVVEAIDKLTDKLDEINSNLVGIIEYMYKREVRGA